MGNLSAEQLKIVQKLNNLPGKMDCIHCQGNSCWLATVAARDARNQIFEMPEGYGQCENAQVVAMALTTLREMSQANN
jgi:hypothetical protein